VILVEEELIDCYSRHDTRVDMLYSCETYVRERKVNFMMLILIQIYNKKNGYKILYWKEEKLVYMHEKSDNPKYSEYY